jgi:hypothetical protein
MSRPFGVASERRGQVSHFRSLRSIVQKGCLPMGLPRANASTVASIRDAKAGKVTRTTLKGFQRW